MTDVLKVEKLNRYYGEGDTQTHVLKDVSLKKGEIGNVLIALSNWFYPFAF